jgi:hypothetical protein
MNRLPTRYPNHETRYVRLDVSETGRANYTSTVTPLPDAKINHIRNRPVMIVVQPDNAKAAEAKKEE